MVWYFVQGLASMSFAAKHSSSKVGVVRVAEPSD